MPRKSVLSEEFHAAKSDSAREKILKKAGTFLYNQLTESVFPHWYGTEWDFNGISETPGKGKIACGYFVSTNLRDAGFNLNRYRVAQQAAADIISLLSDKQRTFTDLQDVINYIWEYPEGLYVVGLDNHVGFLQRTATGVRFIHSSYADPVAVVDEDAQLSSILYYSSIYVVGHLTQDTGTMEKWLTGTRISVNGE